MNEIEAMYWIEQQAKLSVLISAGRKVTLTDGSTFEVEGIGILDAVNELQDVLKKMQAANANKKACKL